MLGLIKHDLMLMKNHYKLIALFTVGSIAVYESFVSRSYIITGIMLFYVAVNYSLHYEEKYNYHRVLASLPFKKSELVIARFCSFFTIATIGIVIAAAMGGIMKSTGLTATDTWINVNDLYTFFVLVIVFTAITIPCYYKFGYEKTRYFRIALIVGTVMLFKELDNQILQANTAFSRGLLELTRLLDGGLMYVAIVGLLVGILFLSFVCSKRIISKKEY